MPSLFDKTIGFELNATPPNSAPASGTYFTSSKLKKTDVELTPSTPTGIVIAPSSVGQESVRGAFVTPEISVSDAKAAYVKLKEDAARDRQASDLAAQVEAQRLAAEQAANAKMQATLNVSNNASNIINSSQGKADRELSPLPQTKSSTSSGIVGTTNASGSTGSALKWLGLGALVLGGFYVFKKGK